MKNVITYAISIGKTDINGFEQYPVLTQAIKRLGHILVRDENTYKMAEKYTGLMPDMVCDPTFLLPVEEFHKNFSDKFIENNKCILLYSYSFADNIKNFIITFAKKNNLKIVSACFDYDWSDYYINCSPLEFCEVLRKVDFVVTTTFHGSIFSFLNHKQFVSIPFSPKVDDVLNKVGLLHTIVNQNCNYEEFERKLVDTPIDYQQVEQKVLQWRYKSLELLQKKLQD